LLRLSFYFSIWFVGQTNFMLTEPEASDYMSGAIDRSRSDMAIFRGATDKKIARQDRRRSRKTTPEGDYA
jgi:hypothetical protein